MLLMLITVFAVAVAMFFLAIGIIFKKKTPLKGSCHAPMKHEAGSSYECGACSCHGDEEEQLKTSLTFFRGTTDREARPGWAEEQFRFFDSELDHRLSHCWKPVGSQRIRQPKDFPNPCRSQ